MKNKSITKLLPAAMGALLLTNPVFGHLASAAADDSSVFLPAEPVWGYFVDNYKNNVSANAAVYNNPAIGTLSGYLDLWKPGDSWNNGTKLNSEVLDANIQYVANLAKSRTKAEEDAAYYDDRRNQTYSAIDGLGSLADVYRTMSGTNTTITSIPDDATTKKYNDGNDSNKGGDSSSQLGKMVDLIGTVRGNYASTSSAKNYYKYMRPFRWLSSDPSNPSSDVVVPTLVPAISTNPSTDGGFPSGHTNASYLASLALAYAVPERFQELLTRASELGNNRIVAGMHSPLDVMGGRVMATALAAAALADPDNAGLKQAAYDQAHDILLKQTGTAQDKYTDYAANKANFTQRLTYNFPQIGLTTKPMVVPKGAEVLLETRQPYLSAGQRRAVLATTGIASGYPLLDDPEGWGRLNLFAAADGYGAFNSDVTVTMDASKGGFYAADSWKNDISGTGKLTKEGTGTLKLTGTNSYSGGTVLNAGTLEGDSATAFGSGSLNNNGGTLEENVTGKLTIGGDFAQAAVGTLDLNVASASDVVEVNGAVTAGGKLSVSFTNGYVPSVGTLTLMSYGANKLSGQFASVEINGVSSSYNAQVVYLSDRIALVISNKPTGTVTPPSGGTSGSTDTNSGGTNNGSTNNGSTNSGTTGSGSTGGSTGGSQEPGNKANPFREQVVSQDQVLKTVNDAIAATKNTNVSFSDTSGHWGGDAIAKAVKLRIVDGYENGTFRPNAPVTRAEFAAMMARAFGLASNPAAASFNDLGSGSNWALGYIGALADKGIVAGYTDGSFKPNDTITRSEMVTMIARVLDLNALATGTSASFSDVGSGYWAANAIRQASSANLVQGVSASSFAPDNTTSRAEAVTLLIRALESDSSIKELIAGL